MNIKKEIRDLDRCISIMTLIRDTNKRNVLKKASSKVIHNRFMDFIFMSAHAIKLMNKIDKKLGI